MSRKARRRLAALLVAIAGAVALGERLWSWWDGPPPAGDGVFEIKPYLQPGDDPGGASLGLLWQAADQDAAWTVEVRPSSEMGGHWAAVPTPTWRRLAVSGMPPSRLYRAVLGGVAPGAGFAYRVRRGENEVFRANTQARKPPGQPSRFVAFGDCGSGAGVQRKVAYQAYRAAPDYVLVTGDIIYMRGRASEYLARFFPVYNCDEARPNWGAPLLRSVPFLAAAGNHDLIDRDLDRLPDGLAYFYYWAQPLNGPPASPGGANTPTLSGAPGRQTAFLNAAGPAYPRMANFSFDYGDVHWTILDANTYVDWTDPALLAWLDADLAAARGAAWRLVAFHHPPFHSSHAHADDQRTRVLAPVLERRGVSVVFSGHVHNYQRSRPLKFTPSVDVGHARPYGPGGQVDGTWALDTHYDGVHRTQPDGVIYLVTGSGGARLYDVGQNDDSASWQPFTARFVSDVYSLTVVDVTSDVLTVRQVSAVGDEIDRFRVTRAAEPEPLAQPETSSHPSLHAAP